MSIIIKLLDNNKRTCDNPMKQEGVMMREETVKCPACGGCGEITRRWYKAEVFENRTGKVIWEGEVQEVWHIPDVFKREAGRKTFRWSIWSYRLKEDECQT